MNALPLKLEHTIREIASQVQCRRILRGQVLFGLVAVGLLLALGASIELLAHTPMPMAIPFAIFVVALGFAIYRCLIVPRRFGVDRQAVARFLDVHYPELDDLVLSSVSLSAVDASSTSEWMVSQVLDQARKFGDRVVPPPASDPGSLRRMRWTAQVAGVLGAILLLALLIRWDSQMLGKRMFSTTAVGLLPFAVEPGDVRVRRGDHQLVWVTTARKNVSMAIRWRAESGDWQIAALEPGNGEGVYAYQLRDLMVDTEYQIQVGRLRSNPHRISVWTPPEVVSMDLQYRFPDYLQMPDKEVPHGGDIVAPEGTRVTLSVLLNKPVADAKLVLDSGTEIALERVENTIWRGALDIVTNDAYQVALRDGDGEVNPYPRTYEITAQIDRAPDVRIRFPRGDDEATALEELAFGFTVRDDYGVMDYGVRYEVAGREAVRVSLKKSGDRVEKVEDEMLLALEGLDLAHGDLITWTVWATDNKPGRAELEGLGDPYFVEIRPFARFYREAVSNEGGSQGQSGGGDAADQKQVIIATWNLRKRASKAGMDDVVFEENLRKILDAQQAVQTQAMDAAILGARGGDLIAELERELTGALAALGEAKLPDPDAALGRALGHEQRAYRLMLKLRPNESNVSQQRGRQRGQRGGRSAQQRELDGLEMAQRRDFREEASTLQEQLSEAAQARNRIDDLARRQAAVNEDIARLISEMESMTPEEREDARRQLEQLRDAQRQTMDALDDVTGEITSGNMDPQQSREAREQLDGARRQMDRSARSIGEDQLQRARASANRALDALRDVKEQLTQMSRQAAAERMRQLQAALDSLRARQDAVIEQAEARRDRRGQRTLAHSETELREMLYDKEAMGKSFKEMMDEASDLAEKSAESQGLMSQKLGDWLRETTREGLYEEMQEGERLVRQGAWDASIAHENAVREQLDAAAERLDAVAETLVHDDLDALEKARDRLRNVMQAAGDSTGLGSGGGRLAESEARRELAAGGFRELMDELREAEALLPEGEGVGRRLEGVREGLAGIGRYYHRAAVPPQYDLVFDRVIRPLRLAAEELDAAIRARRDAYGFAAGQVDAVPEAYRSRVADYFKALAEMDEQ